MASSKRIADLHALISADAKQLVSEMNRASTVTLKTSKDISGAFNSLQRQTNSALASVEARTRLSFRSMSKEMEAINRSATGTSRGISSQFAGMGAKIADELSAVKLGKAALTGLGIGTAVQVTDMAIGVFVKAWQESAEYAKKVQERAESIAEIMAKAQAIRVDTVDANRTPEARISSREVELGRMASQMAALDADRVKWNEGITWAAEQPRGARVMTFHNEQIGPKETGMSVRDFADMALEKADAAQKKWAELSVKVAEVSREMETLQKPFEAAAINNALTDFFGPMEEQGLKDAAEAARIQEEITAAMKAYEPVFRSQVNAEQSAIAVRAAATAENVKLAESYRLMADPTLQYKRQMEQVNELQQKGALTAREAAGAVAALQQRLDEASGVNDALKGFFGGLDKQSATMGDFDGAMEAANQFEQQMSLVWNNVSDRAGEAFADMVLTGEASFKDLANIVARGALEIAARMAIINPILNGIFGLSGTGALPAMWSFGGGKAVGGPVSGGTTYLVGEEGPELFTPRASGNIVPNHALRGGEGGGGGTTVVYQIDARGATHDAINELKRTMAQINASIEPRSLAAVGNAQARGRGF